MSKHSSPLICIPLSFKKVLDLICLFYWGFTPLSTLFQLYHGDSSLIRDPWVNKPVLG